MTSYIAWNATVMDHDNFELLMPRWGYVVSAFVLFLIGFFGFFLNLMVILLMFKDRQLWTPLNIILFNLVCSDFSVSVLGNPFTLISALFHRWIFGHTMCVIYGFFMALLGITSITTLTVISFERYLLVTRPFSSRHLSSKGAVGSVVFIWTYSLALTTPPLMGWGNYVNEAANISCSVNWHEQSRNALTYILFLFAMGQMVPFAVISFSYLNIIRTMKKNSKRLRRVSRAESRATTMVFVMIVAFTVAWTPYSVFALMEQFATNDIISPGVGVIPALVAKSSICYNPLIYVGMNSQFRQSIKRLFGIHNDQNNSCMGRKHNQSSPAQKMTSTNDININFSDCTSTNVKKIERKFAEEVSSELTNDLQQKYQRDFELSTILENKHHLDNERSGENVFDEDSGQKNFEASNSRSLDDKSPILTIETDKISFSKSTRKYNTDVDDHVYGNRGFEDHSTDVIDTRYEIKLQSVKKPNITQSHSLDLSNVQIATKIRKLSIETKLETFSPKGLFKDNVINKIFDKSSKQNKNSFKSYLCSNDSEGDFL